MRVLIIIPAYNEQACIEATVKKLKADMPEVDYIVINDCSTDETLDILRTKGYSYLNLKVNLGIGGAVQSGYRYAYEKGYDIAVQIDGDGQHDTAYLKNVITPIQNGEADIVIGSRFIDKEGFQSTGIRRMGIRFLNSLLRVSTGVNVTDCTSGFRAVNKKFIEVYSKSYPLDYPEPEAIAFAALQGARVKDVPVVMKERMGGVSSIRPLHSGYYMAKVSLAIILCRLMNRKTKEQK